MATITSENASSWQALANFVDCAAPRVGRRVRVIKGRKVPIGSEGEVLRHQRDRFYSDRYESEAGGHLRDMAGRRGWCCLLRLDNGATAWTNADNLAVLSPNGEWLTKPPGVSA